MVVAGRVGGSGRTGGASAVVTVLPARGVQANPVALSDVALSVF